MKTCTKCGIPQAEDAFYFIKRHQRHDSHCKLCVGKRLKQWRKTDAAQAAAQAKYKRLVDSGVKAKRWADKSAGERKRMALCVKRWRWKHKDQHNAMDRQHQQMRRSLAYLKAWPVILEHYGSTCLVCGSDRPCFDHIIPLSQQGPNLISNGQPLCRACNTIKAQMPTQTDYRPDKGQWVHALVALNPWLGEPMPSGRWHLKLGGRERLARLTEEANKPLALPSSGVRSSI